MQQQTRPLYTLSRRPGLDRLVKKVHAVLHHAYHASPRLRRAKDRLNGLWLNHPLHPAVVTIPIGAWTTAHLFDGMDLVAGHRWGRCADAAVGLGIGGATFAAMSGLADWVDATPEQRRIGALHALTNSVALTCYGTSLALRLISHRRLGQAVSGVGYLVLGLGGYLGGELAYRLGTQVDRNAWLQGSDQFEAVMAEADLPDGQPTRVTAHGVPVVLVRQQGRIHALCERCSHAGGPLAEGHLHDDLLTCPWHHSTFRLEDGRAVHGPSPYDQPCFAVRVRDGQIEVQPLDP